MIRISYFIRAFVPLALIVISQGCSSGEPACDTKACRQISVAPHAAKPVESELRVSGASRPLVDGYGGDRPPEGSCFASVGGTRSVDLGPKLMVDHAFRALCLVGGELVSFGGSLDDIRDAPVGKRSVRIDGWTARDPNSIECRFGASAELDVTARAGDVAPLPAMVTPDYRMELTLRLVSTTCKPIDATLRFTFVASDLRGVETSCVQCAM